MNHQQNQEALCNNKSNSIFSGNTSRHNMCQPKWMLLLLILFSGQITLSMSAPPPLKDVDVIDTGLQVTPAEHHLDFIQDSLTNSELLQDQLSFGYDSHTREKRQQPTTYEEFFLAFARVGDLDKVKLLHIHAGVDVNTQLAEKTNWTALMWASRFGHEDVVEYLLENGADPNLQNHHEDTAIIWAIGPGFDNIVKMLCQHHADPNIAEASGKSAITIAAAMNRQDELRVIDQYCMPMDLDHKDDEGRTPINIAAKNGQATMVLLLGYHGNIDEPDIYRMTPLHWSVLFVDTTTLKAVLMLCPDLNITNNNNHTALDIAKEVGNTPGEEIIEDFMNNPSKGCILGSDVLPNLAFTFFDCKQLQCMCSGYLRQTGVRDPECVKPHVNVLARQELESTWHNITEPPRVGPYTIQEGGHHHHE